MQYDRNLGVQIYLALLYNERLMPFATITKAKNFEIVGVVLFNRPVTSKIATAIDSDLVSPLVNLTAHTPAYPPVKM